MQQCRWPQRAARLHLGHTRPSPFLRRELSTHRGPLPAPAGREVLLIAEEVARASYDGSRELFTSLTFSVVQGDKLAVLGPNGAGKSTLLKLIAGLDTEVSGMLSRNKGAAVGYLEQDPVLADNATVFEAVLASDSAPAKVVQEYERALATANGTITKDLERAIDRMNTFNAWEIESEAKRVLEAVGLKEHLWHQPVSKLSGGQRKRVGLAAALLGKPDLLVLDEPTNHLDLETISWLEKELKASDAAVVLVSHDRAFMENTCERVLELDNGKCIVHDDFGGSGSYDTLREAREFRRRSQANAAADARTLFRREAEWMSRQPKARQAKSKARISKFYELTARTKDLPPPDAKPDFNTGTMVRQGNKIMRMKNVGYVLPSNGQMIIEDFTYEFQPGERLGIVGANGSGKTTLLNLIAGRISPTSGVCEPGDTTVVGYFTQYPPPVDESLRVINYIKNVADDRKARSQGVEVGDTPEVLLEKVGFARARQYQQVSTLSGGERRRLHLASVLVERPNLLILDEPTNDLDLNTVEVLEDVCRSYRGVLLVVSHDRQFMDNVVDRLLVLRGDGIIRLFQGSYSEYLELLEEEREEAAILAQLEADERRERAASGSTASASVDIPATNGSTSNGTGGKAVASIDGGASSSGISSGGGKQKGDKGKAAAAAAAPAKKRSLGYYEQAEYKKLCKELEEMNKKHEALQEMVIKLAQSGDDLAKLEKASVEMGALSDSIAEKELRWLELAELAGDL